MNVNCDEFDELSKELYELTIAAINRFREYERIDEIDSEIEKFRRDVIFSAFGLDDSRFIYARVGGGFVQSVTRRLGDLFERYVKEIVKSKLNLSDSEIKYIANIKGHDRELDVLILLDKLKNDLDRQKLQEILKYESKSNLIAKEYIGIGLEVRYAYTIGDSKRIQADRDMAKHLEDRNILPVMLVFSTVNLEQPLRNLSKFWRVKIGDDAFNFLKQITDFDLKDFLIKNKDKFSSKVKEIIDDVFKQL